MISIWLLLMYVMADVIGRGHGGDDDGQDPPHPGGDGFWRGHYAEDPAPRNKTRGKAKNFALQKAVKNNKGRPLQLEFDEGTTEMPVGKLAQLFGREIGSWMWRTIAPDREGWKNVDEEDKNALYEHLSTSFDLAEVEKDRLADNKKGSIESVIQKRYKDRKADAMRDFLNRGGYGAVDATRQNVPDDMSYDNWQKAIDHFLDPEHKKRSMANTANRKHQKYTSRGGTCTYATACYRENLTRPEAYARGHTDKEGNFDSSENEENHRRLVERLEAQTQRQNEEGDSSRPVDQVGVFEDVLGPRRGWYLGLGPKPCPRQQMSISPAPQQTPPPPQFTPDQICSLFQDPTFRDEMQKMWPGGFGSSSQHHDGSDGDDDM